jgi:hypothetical protein
MRINLTTGEFTEVAITSGTLQNISPQASVEVASTATKNTGIILPPYATLSYSDNATVYARNAWDDDSTCVIAVEPFKKAGEGGEYTLPIATSSKLGGVKIGNGLSITESGVLSTSGTSFSVPNSAPAHNCLFRGENITDYFDSGDMSAAIANGTFENIFAGDYIVKSITINGTTYDNVEWVVGDLDYYLYSGDTETTDHHVLLFPRDCIGTSYMNSTDITTGGYVASYMWTTTIPQYVTAIEATFGASHILQHRELLSTATDTNRSRAYYGWTGAASNWAWQDVKVNLFNEYMIYGSNVVDSSFYDCGNANTQIAVMRQYKPIIHTISNWYWLRSVSDSTRFALFAFDGFSYGSGASAVGGMRPYFLLK